MAGRFVFGGGTPDDIPDARGRSRGLSDVSQKHPTGLIERRVKRFLREPVSVRNALTVIVAATFIVVVASGITMRAIDHREYSSVWEGMWWSLQTVTTVGYGDVTPKNAGGKFMAVAVMLEGISFLAIVTAAITSTFVTRAQREVLSRRQQSGEDTRETVADMPADPRLKQMDARLERVESLLLELTRR
jgi:voltage-gated potassium channel